MSAHFEVGKRVIAICSARFGEYKKGEIFELLAIRKSTCKCIGIELNIGIIWDCNSWWWCDACFMEGKPNDEYLYQPSTDFQPIDDTLSTLTDSDILYSETEILTPKTI